MSLLVWLESYTVVSVVILVFSPFPPTVLPCWAIVVGSVCAGVFSLQTERLCLLDVWWKFTFPPGGKLSILRKLVWHRKSKARNPFIKKSHMQVWSNIDLPSFHWPMRTRLKCNSISLSVPLCQNGCLSAKASILVMFNDETHGMTLYYAFSWSSGTASDLGGELYNMMMSHPKLQREARTIFWKQPHVWAVCNMHLNCHTTLSAVAAKIKYVHQGRNPNLG